MSLIDEQCSFLLDVCQLIPYAHTAMGLIITSGELYRTVEQQALYIKAGLSKTMDSYHLKRLAIDLNFLKLGKVCTDMTLLKPIGEFWEELNSKNSWGGSWKSFKDFGHFERRA